MTAAVIARQELAVFLSLADPPNENVTKAASAASPPKAERPASASTDTAKADQPDSKFDVVRIDPDGASVFAGQAPPNSEVTILANGKAVAAAKADETGAWAAVTEREFAPADYEFSLRAKSAERGAATEGQRVRLAVAPTARTAAPRPVPEPASVRAIPAPITFVYNETTFTSEGRRAAALLAAYLNAQRPQAVSLTGHADERGSDRYNMELSQQRLSAVADYLRGQGFAGKLELIPKGKSEPYTGVDRRALPSERVFELDRRVQLRPAR